ncbi:MAG: hypothetical protein ACYCXA_15045 [Actinomycetes bacterium]
MSKPGRLLAIIIPFLIAATLFIWGGLKLSRYPAAIAATTSSTSNGAEASLTMQTVPALGSGPHPDWVSYLIQRPDGQWVHTTMLQVPAHALVHVTILQYDTGSDLRNPLMNQPQGTVGGTITVNGQTVDALTPKNDAPGIGHTFTIPALGVSVPLEGVPDTAKNPCSAAPCTTNYSHNTIQFEFRTGAAGLYHWQCFVPCGTAFLYGNGGPMQTLGFMGGFLKVVA